MCPKVLKNKNFLYYLITGITTIIGNQILSISMALYALSITGTASTFATVIAVGSIPSVVLAPIAGAVADKVNKKQLIMWLDLLRGVIFTIIFILSIKTNMKMGYLYFIVLFNGICDTLYDPVAMAILPNIIHKEDLVDGNFITDAFWEISSIIAPSLSVLIYGIKGIQLIILIDAITFYITALLTWLIKVKFVEVKDDTKILSFIKSGLELYKQDKSILSISINGMLTHLLILPLFYTGLPFLVKEFFKGTDANYATVQTIYAIAAVCTVISIPIMKKRWTGLHALNVGMIWMLSAIVLMFPIVSPSFTDILVRNNHYMVIYIGGISFLFSLAFSSYGVFYSSFNQERVPKQYLGRFYAILYMLFGIGAAVGNIIYGGLFDTKLMILPITLASIGMIIKLVINILLIQYEASSKQSQLEIVDELN